MRSAIVLDDTPEDRAVIARTLRVAGFEVIEAATDEEAFELADSRRPDLIIANPLIRGMDGDEFALALRADPLTRNTPVVFCAAAEDEREVWRLAQACGVSYILIKPCEPDAITSFVDEILGSQPDVAPIRPRTTA
jgi:CheY-like chemotaxis protein